VKEFLRLLTEPEQNSNRKTYSFKIKYFSIFITLYDLDNGQLCVHGVKSYLLPVNAFYGAFNKKIILL